MENPNIFHVFDEIETIIKIGNDKIMLNLYEDLMQNLLHSDICFGTLINNIINDDNYNIN